MADANRLAEALRNISGAIEQIPEDLEGHLWMLDKPLERALEALAAYDAQPEQKPVAYLVCSVNADGSLSLEHAAQWEEAAHEHINDAINEYGIAEAAQWVVRPAFVAPQENSNE